MKEFTFDLQRFAQSWEVNGTTYTSLSAAIKADATKAGDVIKLKTASNAYGNGFQITKNVIIDLGGYNYYINDGSYDGYATTAFTTASGTNVTFQNGSITTRGIATAINATGSVTLFNFSTVRNVSSAGTVTIKSTVDGVEDETSIRTGIGTYALDNGVKLKTTSNNSMTLTVKGDKTATALLANGKTFTATESADREVLYKAIGSDITFNYDETGKASVTNLSAGSSFSAAVNGTAEANTVTYNVTSSGLQAVNLGKLKVLENLSIDTNTKLVLEDYAFTDSKFVSAILTDESDRNNLTISDSLDLNEQVKVVDFGDYSKNFGYLKKISADTYTLVKESDNNKSLSSIKINDGLTVQVSKDFINVPITVSNASTTFQSVTDGDFTISSVRQIAGSSVQAASINGAVDISLSSGTVKVADSEAKPTINAGIYAVSYYGGSKSNDGVSVIVNGTTTQVSGIDVGESIQVGDKIYYRDQVGLRTSDKGYTGDAATVSNNDNSISIELSKLKNSESEFIAPSNKVLEIGNINRQNAVVADNSDNPEKRYADLLVDSSNALGNSYTLQTGMLGDANAFADSVGTISLTGGIGTTIYKELASKATIAAGAGATPDATFKVTAVTGDTFTVNLKTSSSATKVSTDATAITLLSGTINAQAGQTITLGDKGRSFYVNTSSAGMEVTVATTTDGEGSTTTTATIKGVAKDKFTIDGKEFTVDNNSDGMTFTVTEDNIIVSDLATADNDAFTYDGATYSVRGAGFIMTKSGNHSLWSYTEGNGHSIAGGTVTIENLFASDHTWNPTASVRASDNSATLPPSYNSAKVTLVGDDFKQTYGTFTKSGTAVTLEPGSSSNEAKLSDITVGDIDKFDFGENLTDIKIASGVATFIVTEDDTVDGGDGGYKVTLTAANNAAIVDGAKRASLISGSLKSDSYFTATVTDNKIDNRIIAQDDATVILTADSAGASVNGLEVGKSFSIEGGNKYVMSKVGLVDENSRYLPGTRAGNPILLSSLNTEAAWGGLIDKDAVTINATTGTALIVDYGTDSLGNTEPVTLYADYTSGTKSLTKSNSADPWDSTIVINVDDTTVNFSSYFEDAKIKGVQSGATFTVEDGVDFTVQDVRTGAVIGNATNISQTGGTIALSNNGQSIHSSAATITASQGNGITYAVNGSAATIGSMNASNVSAANDAFIVETKNGKVTYTRNAVGLVSSDDRIWTKNTIADTVSVADLLASKNWTGTVYISKNNYLAIPLVTNVAEPWIILSNDKETRYGTLATVDGGYSVTKSSLDSVWADSNTFSINADPVTFSRDFSGAKIYGVQSGASVSAVNATGEFTFDDGKAGATITGTGSTKINQTAGLVIPQVGQTILTGSSNTYSISSNKNNAIAVSVSGTTAQINELSKDDSFKINGYSFEILDNGVVRRNGNQLWQNGKTSATAANLIDGSDWYGLATIEADQNLTVSSALVNNLSADKNYLVDKDNYDNIYGTITKSGSTGKYVYTINTTGANVDTFSTVTIAKEVASVTFADNYFINNSTPIMTDNAEFFVTAANNNTFTVVYDYSTQTTSVNTATALTLTDGTLALSSKNQTLTAGVQTLKAAAGTITANVTTNDDKSTVVTVGSLDTKNDSVELNGETYTYVSGNGMTITIADGVTKFTALDDDTFTIGDYTYTKTAKGLVKIIKNGTNYMWVNDSVDVAQDGVDVNLLKSTDAENWKPIKAFTDGKITIDNNLNETVVLVGDLTNPTEKIYGTLTKEGSVYKLTKEGGANATPDSITVNGVTVTIDSTNYGKVPITPQNNAIINTSETDGTLTFTPANNQSFTVNGKIYTKTSDGLTEGNGDKILVSSTNEYVLPSSEAWGVYNGTITLTASEPTATSTVSNVQIKLEDGNNITATATEGKWTSIGGLNAGDTFTIGNSTYKVLSDGKNVGLYDANGKITKTYAGIGDDGTIDYDNIVKSGNYTAVLTLTGDNLDTLDLTSIPAWSTAPVWGTDDAGDPDPTKNIATVEYSSSKGYTLKDPGTNVGDMASISLGDVKTLTTTIYIPVTTPASGTYIINTNSSFTAASALTITPNEDGAKLTGGKVMLSQGNNVTTTSDKEIKATTGAITVEVTTDSDSKEVITIGELTNGKVFEVDGKSYTMTSIGLSNGNALLTVSNSAVTVKELDGDWETIYEASNGALTINNTTPDLAAVVDLSNSSNAVRYGTLTKTDKGYTYEQSGNNKLNSVTVNGVTAILPATSATITANDATFTATGDLTVNAKETIPTITASTIRLTAGTINAPNNVEINVGGKKFMATGDGAMTIGLEDDKIVVGALDAGDKFTVDNVDYEMTSAGLYIAASKQLVTDGLSSDMKTYTVGGITNPVTLITLTNNDLNLTGTVPNNALIVQTLNDPSSKIATLAYDATNNVFTLSDAGENIKDLQSITLPAKDTTLSTGTINTTVKTTRGSATYTINGKSFTAQGEIEIETAKNSATLTKGTVSLNANSAVTPTDGKEIKATAGTVTVNVNGSTITIGALDSGDRFTYGGKTYTMTAIGLSDGTKLLEKTGSITATELTSGDWQAVKQAKDGALTIDASDSSALVVDTSANPAVKYGELTKNSDSSYTFTQKANDTAPTSITVNGVKATLPETTLAIKANSATFTADGNVTVDAKETIPTITASTIRLEEGTINAPNNVEINVGGKKFMATGEGAMTIGLEDDKIVVGALDAGDKFTVDNVDYEMTSAGLYIAASKQLVTDGLSSDMRTYTVGGITNPVTLITLTNNDLNLTGTVPNNALIVQTLDDPSSKIATLAYDATNNVFTLSDAGENIKDLQSITLPAKDTILNTGTINTTVKTTRGSATYTINGKSFTAQGEIEIETAKNSATLTKGTVSLNANSAVTPTNGKEIKATAGTVTVNVNGSTVTIGALDSGDKFTYGGKTYTMTAIGLSDGTKLLEKTGSVTNGDLTGNDWQAVKQAKGGALTIDASDGSALVVDTSANPAVKYGELTKNSDSSYTFTQKANDAAPMSITVNGVKATLPETTLAIKANSATFTADGNVTVDATTSIPTITGATALTVTAGTVNAPNDLEISVGGMKFTATGEGAMTIGLEDDKVVVGALDAGDKFTVDNVDYEMTSAGLYIAAKNQLVTSGLSDNNTKYTVGTIVYDKVVTLTKGVLDLTDTPAAGYTAYAVSKTNKVADPTKKIVKITYDGTGYTLSEQGINFKELTSVKLSEVKTLTTDLETKVTTPESGTFTINGKSFTANGEIEIKTAKDSATLTDGTVSLTNDEVATPVGKLTATSGTITATVDNNALTIGNLNEGDAFDFGGASYSMTSIGLSNENRLLQLEDDSVPATDLSTGNWLAVKQASGGNLTINSSDGSSLVVDTAVSPAVIYGTLTKSDSGYTFEQDVALTSITLNGVKASFPATTATVTTSSAVFTVSGDFTVDDTTAATNIEDATAITLNSGTINAPEDVEITVGNRKVTATNGDMTVGLQSGKLTIGNLIEGDTFSVDSADYKVTPAGELYTDGKIVTSFSNGTFVVDDAAYVPIIEADGTNLDLTGVTEDAYIYDSATNPTKRLATLDVSGVKYQLNGTANNVITTIDLSDGSVLDNDFPATVSADGSTTVNGSEYKGNGSLTIISDGITSALYEGEISLDPLSEAPELTSDTSALTVNNGTLTAQVVNGKFDKVSDLTPSVSFNFNNTLYTQTALGLVTNGTIREDLAGSTVEVSKLNSSKWSEFLSPDADGTLDLSDASANAMVYDDRDNPSKKLATLIISNGKLILDGNGSNAAAVETIRLPDGANLTVDFTTQVRTTSATVNSQVFNGTGDLLINTRSKAATLYDGTITLDSAAASVKATNGSALAVTGDASINATANNGVFVRIEDLNAGETFTYGGKTYTQTPFGLVTGSAICEDLISSTINLDELGNATFKPFSAPVNGTLDLTKATDSSVVYNSYSNPTRKLADLTVTEKVLTLAGTDNASNISAVKVADGADLTLNFAAKVQAPKGSVTVNDQSYTATSDLILDSDGITSTLTDGSVSIPAAQSVVTTSGNRTVANVGDNAVTLDAKGSTLTIGGLAKDSNFRVDRNEYFITDAALFKTDAQDTSIYTADYSGNVTVAQLDADNWGNVIQLEDAVLDVTGDSTGGYLVSSDLGNLYGSLNKTTNGYTLTKGNANAQLSAVNVNSAALTMAPDFTTSDLSTSKANFDAVKLNDSYANFTLDDSGTAPAFSSNVNAFTLNSGTVAATNAQTVTADNHTIAGDALITNDDNLIVSEISSGETFKLDEKTYKSAEIGLINSDDSALVTAGFENSALNVDAMEETKFIGANNSALDLTEATQSAPVLDSSTNPTKQVATLTVDNGKLTLNGTADNTVDTVKVATDSDLTVDFAAQVDAPQGSVTVNGKSYRAATDVTLQSDGTTSKLASGTVSLMAGESVTAGENSITATAGDIIVNVNGDSITLGGLNDGDGFTVDGTAYKVCAAGLVSGEELYTSDEATTVDALNNDANWTRMLTASYGAFAVDAGTLEDGGEVILVDSTTNPTKTYGTLNKTDGEYLLMKDDTEDEKLAAITVAGTIISIDTELADVPITTVNADASESVFTVKPTAGAITFRVDATGNSPKIDGVDEIDLISGKVQPQGGQIVNPPEGEKDMTISYGNGEHTIGDKTVTIGGLDDGQTIDFELDENGNIKKISGMPKGATITIDGTTYTSPFDNATLTYTDEDGWYFEGWTLPEYSVTIDKGGNIKVDTGIRFRNVISSGRTLGEDGSIQLSGERGDSSVKITNESGVLLKVNDSDASTLAENLAADKGVTFKTDGVAADDLQAVAGATINLGEGKSLTAGDDTAVTATNGATVEVGENSINVDNAAQIEAPADTELNLGAGDYSVNGVEFTSGEKTQATATEDGVAFNLADSTGLTYDGMNLTGDENATASVNSDGEVTLTDGAIADNTTGKTLTIAGEVQLDDKTVNVDSATAVTSTEKGLNVGETELEVEGDDDGYIINIAASAIIGLENIGSPDGVTVAGLDDASIKSDKAGPLTVGDKTFTTSDNSVTWIDDGHIAEVGDVEGTVKGDFSDGLTVNGEKCQVQSDKGSEVEVVADEEGVKAIQAVEADKYTINGKQYETEGEIKFKMSGGSVTGVEVDDATFAIGQDETNFAVNGKTLNLSRNTKPVTLGVDGGAVSAVYGVDGAIGGLNAATVYDLTKATVNGTALAVSGSTFDAIVDDGAVGSIVGVSSPATINSAPNLSIITDGDGAFTFDGNTYHVDDILDSSVTFTTDENSGLTGINDFIGSVSGAVTSLNLNGKNFGTNNGKVTVASDGENITTIDGIKNGDSIGGDIDKASFTMPEGKISINGGEFILEDNGGDAQASDGGKIFTGIAKDASLTVGADGNYRINGRGARAQAGGVFTVNRDGSYLINPEFLPIIEKTPANEIMERSGGGLQLVTTSGTVGAGKDSVAVRNNANVVIQGEPLIVATSGSVTLENYTGAASIGTFEYLNLDNAIKTNSVMFGDGNMTLGDAVITFEEGASSNGATRAQLLNAQGREQKIGFTHTAGGTINASNETADLVLKGNYAEKSDDTQKSGGSNLIGGSGNDMLLIGGGDTADGGAGNDSIYLTNSNLRELGAVIIFGGGSDTVNNFNGGYGKASDEIIINDLNAIEFTASASELVMRSGDATLTFTGMRKGIDLTTLAESSDAASTYDDSYRLKLNDGNKTYNAAVAQANKNIIVANGDAANVFYGDNSGVNFSEYAGAVAVNLNNGNGNIGGAAAQFNGITKLTGGAGNTSLTGAENVSNTLTAGTGNGQIWSNSGNDLMVGNTDATKTGFTTFNYLANDGQDTIAGFDFANDWIDITTANEVTSVSVRGSDVVMFINESETDYLTLAQGKGNDFRINNLTAQVDERTLEFDGLANCFVATGTNATMEVGAEVTQATIWLSDGDTSVHGSYYLGDITVLDASKSAGNLILVGNDFNNTILGGAGTNSIYGGLGDDMLIGGDGKNTFFFAMVSGNDVIQGAHDGDVIDLGALTAADIAGTAIDGSGTAIALTDGSLLEVRSNAAVEYKTADGTYTADHSAGQWVKKS